MVGNDGLGNGGPNGIDLGGDSSPLDADANVQVGEFILPENEDGLEGLEAKGFGLDELDRLAVYFDQTPSLLRECACGGSLFPIVQLSTRE